MVQKLLKEEVNQISASIETIVEGTQGIPGSTESDPNRYQSRSVSGKKQEIGCKVN